MKNKEKNKYVLKVYKYIFSQIIYMGLSAFMAFISLLVLYTIARDFQYIPIIREAIDLFLFIKYNYFGDLLYIVIGFFLTLVIYLMITLKTSKNIASLMKSVEIMASGDLDQRIDVDSNDDIGDMARNINHIIEQLENKTIEERKAQQTKTDLITNVSHDLRTPLTSIIGYLNLIEEDKYKDEVQLRYYTNIAYEKSKDLNILINDLFELTKLQNNSLPLNKIDINLVDEVQLRYYTNIAYEKSKDLNILINDLFELTKLQNNSLPLNKIDINLVELVSQVISYLDYQLNESKMEIRANFSEDKLIVNADPDKLVRVLENLINNAMKYGNDGKYIDIVTRKESNRAVVEIINYGEPIPQSDIPFIFDRFYRVEKSRNRNDGGSGLGLAITKNLIEAHGGQILVKSDNNRTLFKVILLLD